MLILRPLVDGACLIKILRGEKLQVDEYGSIPAFAYLIRGDAAPWPISKTAQFYEPQVRELFDVAGLNFQHLDALIREHCGPAGGAIRDCLIHAGTDSGMMRHGQSFIEPH
jgi:hypothetical protein